MSDLISRQAAIGALKEDVESEPWDYYSPYDAISTIKALPSAQPEIIYCKDCIHHEYETETLPYCLIKDYGYGWKDTDFCSYAERRKDE